MEFSERPRKPFVWTMAPIPIVLLKTRSTPHDTYDEYFSSLPSSSRKINPERQAEITDSSAPPQSGLAFCPVFVPVLEHRSNTEQLGRIKQMLLDGSLGSTYGGMIFTSQRAVEAFASVLEEMRNQDQGGMVRSPPALFFSLSTLKRGTFPQPL